jgi:hypothetical protein
MEEQQASQKPAEGSPKWPHKLAGLVVGVAVFWLTGARLQGWPLMLWLAGSAMWEQLADLLASLSDWVLIKVKDVEVHRRVQQGSSRMVACLEERERLTGEEDRSDLEQEVDLGR